MSERSQYDKLVDDYISSCQQVGMRQADADRWERLYENELADHTITRKLLERTLDELDAITNATTKGTA